MRNAGYFRTPTVNGDVVIFVSEDDLWSVPLAGGIARRLTAGLGAVSRPAISPDGKLVAFTSMEEGHAEVYVMPAAGGPPKRLTYIACNSTVVGWTPRGDIVFRSDHRMPFMMRRQELYRVSPGGGEPKPMNLGVAHEISFGARDRVVLGRNTLDPATWKRYRGGRVGRLWVDARGNGAFKRILDELNGNIASPMWIGERIYFISDHQGIGNIYSVKPDGKDIRRHTDHGEYYARAAASDGRSVAYAHAADLWAFDVKAGVPARIDVEFPSPRTQRNRKFAEAAGYLQGYAPHPDGSSVAVEARGHAFTMPLWDGAVRDIGGTQGVRYRLAQWLADGKRVVCVSDEGGEERIEVYDADGARTKRFDKLDLGRITSMVANPRTATVAVANNRAELHIVDADSGKDVIVERNAFGFTGDIAWSPDGSWLAYDSPASPRTRSIKLVDPAGKPHEITRPDFNDWSASFDPDGAYLYFVSARIFDPVYDAHFFEASFPLGTKPFVVSLRKDARNPFITEAKGFGEPDKEDEKAEEPKGKKVAEKFRVDLEGIEDRVAVFPLPEKRYRQIAGIKGKAIILSLPVRGSLAPDIWTSPDDAGGSIEVFDFETQRSEMIFGGVTDFTVARDGSTMIYRTGNHRLRAVKAGEKPDEKFEKDPPSRRSGWIDLSRIRVSVEPGAEWAQMFREAWRLQRETFWTTNMSGVDWNVVYDRYVPLVEKVATRGEFADLIWEMQGELGTSHAYEMGGDHRRPPQYPVGQLGVELAWNKQASAYRIRHIVRGDPWDENGTSPLTRIGAGAAVGDTILAINGKRLSLDEPPAAALVNQAGQHVEVTLGDKQGNRPRTVTVKTLRDEWGARYREWVEGNRDEVHRRTNGRVGYIHIRDMSPPGYSEFHRYFQSELNRDGLVIDVRYNGGGHFSALVLEKLARKRLGYDIKRWGVPEPYPADSVMGPLVCITNENAGSDGDIFSHNFKLMKLGPVVGRRTWGGVVGIWVRYPLADNGFTTQPEFSFWFKDVGWGVENYGTDPDLDVDIAPQDYAEGRDPQMEAALRLITDELKKNPPKLPDFSKRPVLKLPKLPKR
ncbi:MAG: S41 family peptidase [Actinomycetota bacterium]